MFHIDVFIYFDNRSTCYFYDYSGNLEQQRFLIPLASINFSLQQSWIIRICRIHPDIPPVF